MDNVVIGMAHRGRLNFLAGPLRLPPEKIFHKMKGYPEFADGTKGSGDVLSHLGTSVNLTMGGKSVHVSLLNNPSHLEVNCQLYLQSNHFSVWYERFYK